jgi:hypothetical protein
MLLRGWQCCFSSDIHEFIGFLVVNVALAGVFIAEAAIK